MSPGLATFEGRGSIRLACLGILLCVVLALGSPSSALSAVPSPTATNEPSASSGGSESVGGSGGCQEGPAACLGATVNIPGGTAGATLGRGDCLGGRIVTPETGGQSDGIPYCPDVDGDGITDSPPTHGQVVAAICPNRMVPTPVLATSPEDRGFTGLETWFWSAGRHDVSTAGTVGGYAVGCRITPSLFAFDTGDIHATEFGTPRSQTATRPGHEGEDTPVRHLYERWGTFEQALTITWRRTTSVGQDTLTTTTARSWQVVSIVSGAAPSD